MAALKFSFLAFFLMPLVVLASDEKIDIKNQLSQCSEIRNPKLVTEGSVPVLSFDLVLKDSIADCGCKSALGAFSVYAQRDSYLSHLISGKVVLNNSGKKNIPVAADNSLVSSTRLDVSFSCAQPD
ncbi:DUF2195 family protein [Cellvibrio sp.]